MQICGVICEYNPFHRGHEKQLRMIRAALGEETAVVCLMSGSFVQRGEPAVFDKRTRAAAAVLSGANLVLELPVTKALSSAEGFARGGVEIFTKLSLVDTLAFGCESGSGEEILRAAAAMCSPSYEEALRERIKTGLSYPAARQQALGLLPGDPSPLQQPLHQLQAFPFPAAGLHRWAQIDHLELHAAVAAKFIDL